jgi:hypothetical protein
VLATLVGAGCGDGDDGTVGPAGATPASSPPTSGSAVDDPTAAAEGAEEDLADPVAVSEDASFGNGVTARLVAIDAVEVVGHLPGEISGPGVAITVEMTNGSTEPVGLDQVTVDLMDREQASAPPILPPEPEGLSGTLAPGASATGRYQFTLPPEERSDASVRVSYSVTAPTVVFVGDLPDG